MYLEQTVVLGAASQQLSSSSGKDDAVSAGQTLAASILLDFWGKVTPGILQLVSHSKVQ